MKAKSINVQIVKNLGNYESIRIGGEWELNGEQLDDAIRVAVSQLETAYKNTQPKEQPKTGKVSVRFKQDNALLQKIVKRVQETDITIEGIEEHYTLDDEAKRTIELAIAMRAKK